MRSLGCGADKHTATESLHIATEVPGVVELAARVVTGEMDEANDFSPIVWSGGRASRGACNAADRVSATAVQKAGLIGQDVRCVVPGGEDGEQASLTVLIVPNPQSGVGSGRVFRRFQTR